MKSVLPRPPPPKFDQEPSQVSAFARELVETFTVQTLIKHTLMVFGVRQNVCALGVFDDNLLETLDALWELLLAGMIVHFDIWSRWDRLPWGKLLFRGKPQGIGHPIHNLAIGSSKFRCMNAVSNSLHSQYLEYLSIKSLLLD